MKLVIEIEDVALRQAIEAQVSKAVADLTAEAIVAKSDEILNKKFQRFDFGDAVAKETSKKLDAAIEAEFERVLGSRYGSARRDELRMLLSAAAAKLIKDAV